MKKNVYWLTEIYQDDRDTVGGKAANLGDLARNLPCPDGFCLVSEAYYKNLKHYGIDQKIREKLDLIDTGNIKVLEQVSLEIGEMIIEMPLLPDYYDALTTAFHRLAEGKDRLQVAVRSSATAEDLVGASFAGQQETFLEVEGIENVLIAVKKCWASLWTARAIHYRERNGFEHHLVKMAVIVQEMIPSQVSGVMFTANPVTNSREEIRIEAVRGLGEQLVSGHAAGDVYILKKSGEANIELVSKEVADPGKDQMLTDYDIRELAHTGLKIENYYGDYQDIEWAYWKGKMYFLQTRPITTLRDEDLPDINLSVMNKYRQEVMAWVAERFPDPIMPIDGIVVKVLFMAQFEAMQASGYTIGNPDWGRVDKGIFPEFFVPPPIRPKFKRVLQFFRAGKIMKSDPAGEWADEQVYLLDMLEKLKRRDMSALPLEIVLDYITEGFNHFHYFNVLRYKYFSENKVPSAILLIWLRFMFKDKAVTVYEKLVTGLDNATLRINRAVRDLAAEAGQIRDVGMIFRNNAPDKIFTQLEASEGGREFLIKFHEFLLEFGERETNMGLGGIGSPTWQDSPEVVFGIIRAMLDEDLDEFMAREEARAVKAKEAEELVNSRLSKGIYSLFNAGKLFHKLIRHARSFAAFRENSHYDVTRSLHVFRILFAELGKRWVRMGLIKDPRDIYYLTYFEIKEILLIIYHGLEEVNVKELNARIISRKAEQERRMARWSTRNRPVTDSEVIRGVPVSQGLIKGPVRIIKSPGDFHRVRKGDILVAPYTNPSWTPLFTTAAGLLAETGGAASHAAIIAREYGVPAVMGVVRATEMFRDGEIILINGSTGVVQRA
ncbi:PEP/pyruvate-binding domain-containing protein [Phosphitispora sp. TUW77]|uniref:PEP/pyruvate-binding domain-containing protein n=1 Tax=Phosphitispora sp. TUW77 TaxID=3152361 RepID=UPI003AB55177